MKIAVAWAPLLLLLPSLAIAHLSPTPVSPGDLDRFETISQTCPTFTWTTPGNAGLELLVYGLDDEGEVAAGDEPAIRVALPPGATAWTPPTRLCLDEGRLYGWLVLDRRSAAPEPEVRLFAIAAGTGAGAEVEKAEAQDVAAGIAARAVERHPQIQEPGSVPQSSVALDTAPLASAEVPPAAPSPLPADIVTELGVRYQDQHFGHVGIPGNTFVLGSEDEDDVVQRSTAGSLWLSSIGDGDVYLLAPVPLPEGVVPTSLVCEALDTAPDDDVTITTRLNHRVFGSTTRVIFGPHELTTSGTPGLVQVPYGFAGADMTGTNDYWWAEVRWEPDIAGDTLRFYGCRVGYSYWNLQH